MPEIERRRKKPGMVVMLLWDGANLPQVVDFIGGEDLASWEAGGLFVWNDQEEAWLPVPVGHRVARGMLGELYPMSPRAYEETTEPAPARHPLVVWVNAVNGDTLPRCFPDVEAAYDAAATEYPYNNTRVTLGWCTQTHAAAAAGEDGS